MQWVLQRLVAMCGAAEWPDIELDDNSDDFFHFNHNYVGCTHSRLSADKYDNICEWIPGPAPLVLA
jgi:hypothetical protein